MLNGSGAMSLHDAAGIPRVPRQFVADTLTRKRRRFVPRRVPDDRHAGRLARSTTTAVVSKQQGCESTTAGGRKTSAACATGPGGRRLPMTQTVNSGQHWRTSRPGRATAMTGNRPGATPMIRGPAGSTSSPKTPHFDAHGRRLDRRRREVAAPQDGRDPQPVVESLGGGLRPHDSGRMHDGHDVPVRRGPRKFSRAAPSRAGAMSRGAGAPSRDALAWAVSALSASA